MSLFETGGSCWLCRVISEPKLNKENGRIRMNYEPSMYTRSDNLEAGFQVYSGANATFYGHVGRALHDLLSWLCLFKDREKRASKLCRTSEATMVAARWERGAPFSTLAKPWANVLARGEVRARRVSFR